MVRNLSKLTSPSGRYLPTMTQPRAVVAGKSYMITRRCSGRRHLLRPDDVLNNLFIYCLALAAARFGIAIHRVMVMSNHYHIVLTDVLGVLPDFVAWLNRLLALCIQKHRGWDDLVWEPKRQFSAVALESEEAVWDKLLYAEANSVSAGLVFDSQDWPGVHTPAHCTAMKATRPDVYFTDKSPKEATLTLCPPPMLSECDHYREDLHRLDQERQAALRKELRRQGRAVMGKERVLATSPRSAPKSAKRKGGRNPLFAAVTRRAYQRAAEQLRAFRTAYREAFLLWQAGHLDVEFPCGTFAMVRRLGARAAPA